MKRLHKLFLLFLSILLVLPNLSLQAQTFGPPIWLNKDTFAQYEFKSSAIFFLNKTTIPFENDASATLRWECTEMNDDLATLNVSISFTGEKKSLFISKEVDVNTTSRQVFLSNGTLIGTTRLWAKANPTDGEEIVVWDVPPDKIVGSVEIRGFWSSNTPQGAQKIYDIEGKGTINGKNALFDSAHEVDTGIMIEGILSNEATLLALGIDTLGVNGQFSFSDTNVDLGPKEMLPEILGLLPILLVVILFISVFVILYYRRRKRRRHN